jgi:hypothetical protein
MSDAPQFVQNHVRNSNILELWEKGFSFGRIVNATGLRRNQIAGVVCRAQKRNLVHRRGPPCVHNHHGNGGNSRKIGTEQAKAMAAIRWAARPAPPPPAVPAPPLPHLMLELPSGAQRQWHSSRGCAYMTNETPADPAWCNAPAVDRLSWCAFHLGKVAQRGR